MILRQVEHGTAIVKVPADEDPRLGRGAGVLRVSEDPRAAPAGTNRGEQEDGSRVSLFGKPSLASEVQTEGPCETAVAGGFRESAKYGLGGRS